MKKVKLIFIGEYEEVKGDNSRLPKWDFKEKGVGGFLECVLMKKTKMTAKATGKDFFIYDVRHRGTREPYSLIPNALLEQRLSAIPLYSAIKIVYKGLVPPKNYMNYEVFKDKDFKFDPSVWQEIVYEQAAGQTQVANNTTTSTQQNTTAAAPATTAAVTDDDLPF